MTSYKHNYIHESNPCISYKTEQIFCSSQEKLLGISINNTLSWQAYLSEVFRSFIISHPYSFYVNYENVMSKILNTIHKSKI
jgi:hypothetical protein